MYQGNNPIALQSREWLIQALLELMEEMPYSKITILTICRRADLSRQTFYHFFRDKEDILHFYFQRIYQQYFRSLERQQDVCIDDFFSHLAAVVGEHRPFLDLLIRNHLESVILDELPGCITLFTARFDPVDDSMVSDYAVAFLTGALTQMLICWLKKSDPASPAELSQLLRRILAGEYFTENFHFTPLEEDAPTAPPAP